MLGKKEGEGRSEVRPYRTGHFYLAWTLRMAAKPGLGHFVLPLTNPKRSATAPLNAPLIGKGLVRHPKQATQAITLISDTKSAENSKVIVFSFESAARSLDAIADESGWSPSVAGAMRVDGSRLRNASTYVADDSFRRVGRACR